MQVDVAPAMSPAAQNSIPKPSTPVTSTAPDFTQQVPEKGLPIATLLFAFFSCLALVSFIGLLCIIFIRSRCLKRWRRKERKNSVSLEHAESEHDTSAMDQEAGKVKPKKRRASKQAGAAHVSKPLKSKKKGGMISDQQEGSSNFQHRLDTSPDFTNVFGDMEPSPILTPLKPLHFSAFIVKLPSIYEQSGSPHVEFRQETLTPTGSDSLSPVQSVHEKVSKPARARQSKGILKRTEEDPNGYHVQSFPTHLRTDLRLESPNKLHQTPSPGYESPYFQDAYQKQENEGSAPKTSNMKRGFKNLMKLITGKSKQEDQDSDSDDAVENSKAHVLKSDALKSLEKSKGKVSTVQKVDVWAQRIEPAEVSENSYFEGSSRATTRSWTNDEYSSTEASIQIQRNEEEFNLERLTSQRSKTSHTSSNSTSKASLTQIPVNSLRGSKKKTRKRTKDITSQQQNVVKPSGSFKESMIPQDSQISLSKHSNSGVFRLSYDLANGERSQHTNDSDSSSNSQPICVIEVHGPNNTSRKPANQLPRINASNLPKDPNVLYTADKSPLLTESPKQLSPKKSLSPLFAAIGPLPSPQT